MSTNISFKSFENGQVQSNCEKVTEFIALQELKRDQIVSITMNETIAEQGNNLTTIFYRQPSQQADALPLDSLKFNVQPKHFSWDKLEKDANAFFVEGNTAIAVANSAKNVGSVNSQVVFYTSEYGKGSSTLKTIWEDSTNYQALAKRVKEWLNKYIAPHQLVSVSFSDEFHPDDESNKQNERIFATICHTAGPNPAELASVANAALPSSGIYSLKVMEGKGDWKSYFEEATEYMNNKGGDEGHVVASANSSHNEHNVVVVYSWTSLQHQKLEDLMRPFGCCTLF